MTDSRGQAKSKVSRFVTGDESSFILEFHHSMKWHHDVSQEVEQQIATQKFTLTIIYGISGFHMVDLMTEQHDTSSVI
jgi:hypothetical protein